MRLIGLLLAVALGAASGQPSARRAAPDSALAVVVLRRNFLITADSASTAATGVLLAAALPAPAHRSPLIAGALGFIVPGGGHFYAGETGRGWAVLGVTMVGAFFALSDGAPRAAANAGSVAFVGGWTFSVVDGILAARRFNRRQAHAPADGSGI